MFWIIIMRMLQHYPFVLIQSQTVCTPSNFAGKWILMCHFGNNFSEIKISLPKEKRRFFFCLKNNNNNNRIYFFRNDSYSKASNRHRWNERHILLTQPQPKQFPQQLGGPAYLHSAPALSARQQLAELCTSGVSATDCYSC